jgi:general secretion pathway protein E
MGAGIALDNGKRQMATGQRLMEHPPQLQLEAVPLEAANESRQRAICDCLVAAGKLDPANVGRALKLQAEQDQWEKIGQILIKLGLTSEHDLAECLSTQLGVRLVLQQDFVEDRLPDDRISVRFLKLNKILVLDEDDDVLTLVMAEPQDDYARDAVKLCCGKDIVPCLGIPSEIEHELTRIYDGCGDAAGSEGDTSVSVQFLDDVEQLKELAGEAPIIKLVNQIIRKAAESGASDIHIEPFEGQLQVRYRIDGLLRGVDAPPVQSAAAVISRVKIMANLNIAERRLSQDGRFKQRVRGNDFDVRVSTVPTMHGESVVLRLLRRDDVLLDFASLGFSPEQTQSMHDILAMPHGILLVTGPTGSGKSTTLYAALRHLNEPERMIITVEDPVEYNIHGINQMQVKPQIGLNFANALRSIVRQDPDIIMIGEMRDGETAEIAVQSALTGHLVLSTLHTNDAPGSIMRLLDMGVQDYLLTSAVNAVQAQRLVRTLCQECREEYTPVGELIKRFDLERFAVDRQVTLYRASGCTGCGGTGYAGRSAILEILPMTDDIKGLVMKRCDASEIAKAAIASGMVTMLDDGLFKAAKGITTIEEVLRVAPEKIQ